MDLSFQEKKLLENLMIGCRDVCKVNTEQVIFKTLEILKNINKEKCSQKEIWVQNFFGQNKFLRLKMYGPKKVGLKKDKFQKMFGLSKM